jgi:hypothetical protein
LDCVAALLGGEGPAEGEVVTGLVAELPIKSIASGFVHKATLGGAGADVAGFNILRAADTGRLHGVYGGNLRSADSLNASGVGGVNILTINSLDSSRLLGSDLPGANIGNIPHLGGLDIINGVHLRGVALGGADTLGADIIDLPSLGGLHIGNWAHLRGQDALRLDLIGSIACWTLDILHLAHASSSGLGCLSIGHGSDLGGLRVADIGNAGTLRLIGCDSLGGNLVGPVELAEGQLV